MGNPDRPVVLIVEDDELHQHRYLWFIHDKVEPLVASTIAKGESLFAANKDRIAAIVMDACVPGRTPNTFDLVRSIRSQGFAGPMIASSSESLFREQLVDTGCSHQAEKMDVHMLLKELLSL